MIALESGLEIRAFGVLIGSQLSRSLMFGHLHLLNYELDLDAPWVAKQQFDEIMPDELPPAGTRLKAADWRTCISWIAPLFKHSLDAQASVLYIIRDLELECLRQFILVGRSIAIGDTLFWFELKPMAWPMAYAGLRALRFMSMMVLGAKRGNLYYRYKGKRNIASCYKQSKDALIICFSSSKPTTLPDLREGGVTIFDSYDRADLIGNTL